jgi:AAA domain
VLYVAAEDYAGILMRRRAWCEYNGVDRSLIDVASAGCNLLDATYVEDLAAEVLEGQYKLVVIDTLHRSMGGGSEVSDVDTAAVTRAVDMLQAAFYATAADVPIDPTTEQLVYINAEGERVREGQEHVREEFVHHRYPHVAGRPAVLLVHHPNQRNNTLRGHGGFYGDSDTIFRTTRKKRDRTVELYCEKQKNGQDGWLLQFDFVKVGKSGVAVPIGETRRGANAAEANHVRWHVKREAFNEDCEFCVAGIEDGS